MQSRTTLAVASLALVLLITLQPALGQQNGEQSLRGQNAILPGQWANSKAINSTMPSLGDTPTNDAIKVQYVNVNGLPVLVQFTYVGPPKILPIATADSYPEGSSINLICTVSGGQRRGLTLQWQLNGDLMDDSKLRYSEQFNNVAINMDDADISILKIKNATAKNSGQYTCTAKNPLGQDSTSVKIVING